MTQEHPITPPPELVEQWIDEEEGVFAEHIATQAARWGADQELEACSELVRNNDGYDAALALRADRRPKPPSLKEQALETLRQIPIDPEAGVCSVELDIIRRALESLPD